jgi:hypothetical protein
MRVGRVGFYCDERESDMAEGVVGRRRGWSCIGQPNHHHHRQPIHSQMFTLLLHSSQSSSLINIRIIYHFLYFVDNPENPIHHQRAERQFAVHQGKIDL